MTFDKIKVLKTLMSVNLQFFGSTLGYIGAIRGYYNDKIPIDLLHFVRVSHVVNACIFVFCFAARIYFKDRGFFDDKKHNPFVNFLNGVIGGVMAALLYKIIN